MPSTVSARDAKAVIAAPPTGARHAVVDRLREAEVEHLHDAVRRDLDVRGLEIAVNDPFLVRRVESLAICRASVSASSTGNGPSCDTIGQRLAFDELEHERADRAGGGHVVFHAVDGGDVRMIERASTRASRSKRASRSGSAVSDAGRILIATSRPSVVSRARYTSPMPPTPSRE